MAKRALKPTESQVLKACLDLLAYHPKIAFAYRQNTGAVKIDKRYVKFGTRGQPDIVGMLKGGRYLAVEVKRPGKAPTAEQNAFLYAINKDGGFGCWVDSVERLAKLLESV